MEVKMSQKKDLKQLIAKYNRRLQKLKEKQAEYGGSVDPQILIEIEDIETRLKCLHVELKDSASDSQVISSNKDERILRLTTKQMIILGVLGTTACVVLGAAGLIFGSYWLSDDNIPYLVRIPQQDSGQSIAIAKRALPENNLLKPSPLKPTPVDVVMAPTQTPRPTDTPTRVVQPTVIPTPVVIVPTPTSLATDIPIRSGRPQGVVKTSGGSFQFDKITGMSMGNDELTIYQFEARVDLLLDDIVRIIFLPDYLVRIEYKSGQSEQADFFCYWNTPVTFHSGNKEIYYGDCTELEAVKEIEFYH